MDKTTKDKVEYTIAFISNFAKTHSLSTMQAYRYLKMNLQKERLLK